MTSTISYTISLAFSCIPPPLERSLGICTCGYSVHAPPHIRLCDQPPCRTDPPHRPPGGPLSHFHFVYGQVPKFYTGVQSTCFKLDASNSVPPEDFPVSSSDLRFSHPLTTPSCRESCWHYFQSIYPEFHPFSHLCVYQANLGHRPFSSR